MATVCVTVTVLCTRICFNACTALPFAGKSKKSPERKQTKVCFCCNLKPKKAGDKPWSVVGKLEKAQTIHEWLLRSYPGHASPLGHPVCNTCKKCGKPCQKHGTSRVANATAAPVEQKAAPPTLIVFVSSASAPVGAGLAAASHSSPLALIAVNSSFDSKHVRSVETTAPPLSSIGSGLFTAATNVASYTMSACSPRVRIDVDGDLTMDAQCFHAFPPLATLSVTSTSASCASTASNSQLSAVHVVVLDPLRQTTPGPLALPCALAPPLAPQSPDRGTGSAQQVFFSVLVALFQTFWVLSRLYRFHPSCPSEKHGLPAATWFMQCDRQR